MIVPVAMGKEGKIINKIKKITGCHIMVMGPYTNYNYQNIEILGHNVKETLQALSLIYTTVFKVLKKQPIKIFPQIKLYQEQRYIEIGF